jgi:pimeloyl-ACP methyl ester carboxylesterase
MPDLVVLLPGITGSRLSKDGKVVWGFSGGLLARSLLTRGRHMRRALYLHEDPVDEDDLGDGIVADRLLPDLHLLPGLWKIDGYSEVSDMIERRFAVERGKNFFHFPYDWRRDNRVSARKLQKQTHTWLNAWRQRSGNDDARLILIGHSMGGLVARYFLEVLEGWRSTRALITFGTPYRGSLNAVNALSNGMKKGPFGLLDLTRLARSLTSLYQLLPTYRCYDPGTGTMHRVHEEQGIPNIALDRAKEAARFHREIREAVEANRQNDRYRNEGYKIFPVVGIAQRTYQSARRTGSKVEMRHVDFEGENKRGDGTVPRVSATPLELSESRREIFSGTKHASLQNGDATLVNLDGILTGLYFNLGTFRRHTVDPRTVSLEVGDLHWTAEPIVVNARLSSPGEEDGGDHRLIAHLTDRTANRPVDAREMTRRSDRDYTVAFDPPDEGIYEVRVTGGAGVEPAEDAFAVAGIGPDEADLPDEPAREDLGRAAAGHEDAGRTRPADHG